MKTTALASAEEARGKLTLILDPVAYAVAHASGAGSAAGSEVIATAVKKATAKAVRRAAELETVIRRTREQEAELEQRKTDLGRAKLAAQHSLFAAELDGRLKAIADETGGVKGLLVALGLERAAAHEELQALRDEAIRTIPADVQAALRTRCTVAEEAKRKAAEAVGAAVAGPLTEYLRLTAELEELGRAKPVELIVDALDEALPVVFSEGGLAPAEKYDPKKRPASEEEEPAEYDPAAARWRPRPGREHLYLED